MIVESYGDLQDTNFWAKFPHKELPDQPETRIEIGILEQLIDSLSSRLLPSEIERARKVVYSLRNGAPSCQATELPHCMTSNAKSTKFYSKEITDTFAAWLKAGHICGPFETPPVSKFRVNPVMALPSGNKIRPVLNVSQPLGKSFNDNIVKNAMEKVKMSSARNFGYDLKKCGFEAKISKYDMKDAYKNVPAPIKDLRLQGFKWLNRFFIETKQIFGAKTSVANFDILGHTIVALARASCCDNNAFVHRHLDDVPIASPKNSGYCEEFSGKYEEICKKINIQIANSCPYNDKAFKNTTFGKVLGIWFDSVDLTWVLPEDKKERTLTSIHDALYSEKISVLQMQKLMGNLNNVSLMCKFLSAFRKNLNECLGDALRLNVNDVILNVNAKNDLKVWAGFLMDDVKKMPIASYPSSPPLYCKSYTSDAAGYSDDIKPDAPGVASIGFDEEGKVIFAYRKLWGKQMISRMKDNKGKTFGRKTAFLEFVGLLLPFLLMPEKLKNQHVVLKVDNISCYFGWENKCMKNDSYTSIMIRALYMISCYLCSIIHVVHLPRKTTWDSCTVDRMSRLSTTSNSDCKMLNSFDFGKLPEFVVKWLDNPVEDWSIAMKMLDFVKQK